jgi:hypothetical protein
MNVLTFDIETVPDTDAGRRLYGLDGLSDADVARVMFAKRREQTGDSDFLRHPLHRVVAISAVLRSEAPGGAPALKVWSLGDLDAGEAEIVRRFFDGIEKYTPTLVSWNGSGFDLPVLHYRALLHQVKSPRYWDVGDDDREFRFNNYLSRFHWRHIDLMDVLSGFQPRARAGLSDTAIMLGFPGKLGMDGSQVWGEYLQGGIGRIRDYCETDALNTWLIYLRFQLIRGILDDKALDRELERVRRLLADSKAPHLQAFLEAWNAHSA